MHANPRCGLNFFGSRQPGASDHYFLVNFERNGYLPIEIMQKFKLMGAGKSDEGRGIGYGDHELRR
jgi:hypothetical protein